jgi:hypothetical protein
MVLEVESTHMANYISWNKAYSVFPYTTFINSETFLLKCIMGVTDDTLRSWKELCLKVSVYSDHDHITGLMELDLGQIDAPSTKMQLCRHRRIGDDRSWVIHLNTVSLIPSSFPDHLIYYVGFVVRTQFNGTPSTHTEYHLSQELQSNSKLSALTV